MQEKMKGILQDGILFLQKRFLPKNITLGVFLLLASLILFLFFLGSLIVLVYELLLMSALPSWAAILTISTALLLTCLLLLVSAKKSLTPKKPAVEPSKKLTVNDVVVAFMDGLLNRKE